MENYCLKKLVICSNWLEFLVTQACLENGMCKNTKADKSNYEGLPLCYKY